MEGVGLGGCRCEEAWMVQLWRYQCGGVDVRQGWRFSMAGLAVAVHARRLQQSNPTKAVSRSRTKTHNSQQPATSRRMYEWADHYTTVISH